MKIFCRTSAPPPLCPTTFQNLEPPMVTLKSSKDFLMNLIMTMRFMKNPLNFQVLLQQSCLVDIGLYITKVTHKSLKLLISENFLSHKRTTSTVPNYISKSRTAYGYCYHGVICTGIFCIVASTL